MAIEEIDRRIKETKMTLRERLEMVLEKLQTARLWTAFHPDTFGDDACDRVKEYIAELQTYQNMAEANWSQKKIETVLQRAEDLADSYIP